MRYMPKIRPFLYTSLSCALTLIAFPTVSVQAAQSLSPSTGWSVNQVGSAADLSKAYCAVAREFDQNTILTIARNPDLETSLAIDVQSAQFNSQQGLRVQLDPGSDEQRAFQVFPANEKAVVVRLGQDSSFFKALRRTRLLRAELGDIDYRFTISDIAEGEMMLSQCVQALNMAQPYTGPQTAQNKAPEINVLQSEVEALRAETQRLSKMLKNDPVMDSESSALEDMSAPIMDVVVEQPSVERNLMPEHSSDAFKQEQKETQILRSEVRRGQDNLEDELIKAKKDAEIETFKKDNDRLRALVTELENERSRIQKKLEETEISAREGEALKREAAASALEWTQKIEAAQTEISGLKSQNAGLREKLDTGNDDKDQLITTLTQQLERSSEELLEANAKSQTLITQKDKARSAHDALVKTLQNEVATLQKQMQSKDKEIADLSRLAKEMALVKSQKEQLVLELEGASQDQALTASLQRQIKVLEEGSADLKSKNETLRLAVEQKDADAKLKEQQLAVLQSELQGKASEAQNTSAELELKNLELRKQNSELLEKVTRLQKSSAQSDELRAELTKTLTRIGDLEEKLEQARTQNADFAKLESRQSLFEEKEQKPAQPAPAKEETIAKEEVMPTIQEQPKSEETSVSAVDLLNARMIEEDDRIAGTLPVADPPKTFDQRPETEAQAQEIAMKRSLENRRRYERMERKQQEPDPESKPEPISRKIIEELKEVDPKASPEKDVETETTAQDPETLFPPMPAAQTKPTPEPETISWNQQERMVGTKPRSSERPRATNTPSVSQPIAVAATYRPAFRIADIVAAAEIVLPKNVQYLESSSSSDSAAYAWQVSNIYGTAELKPFVTDERFDDAVKTYLEKTQNRCEGDFAVVPEFTDQIGDMRLDSYDIACVSGQEGADSSASLLFFNKSGTFTALAHEGPLSDLDATITLRNRLKDVLSETAS